MKLTTNPYSKCKTVAEVQKAVGTRAAGQEELDYILAHPDEFPKMKDGKLCYFFGAADGGLVPYVFWFAGKFWRDGDRRDSWWGSLDRVVIKDLAPDTEEVAPLPPDLIINGVKYRRV